MSVQCCQTIWLVLVVVLFVSGHAAVALECEGATEMVKEFHAGLDVIDEDINKLWDGVFSGMMQDTREIKAAKPPRLHVAPLPPPGEKRVSCINLGDTTGVLPWHSKAMLLYEQGKLSGRLSPEQLELAKSWADTAEDLVHRFARVMDLNDYRLSDDERKGLKQRTQYPFFDHQRLRSAGILSNTTLLSLLSPRTRELLMDETHRPTLEKVTVQLSRHWHKWPDGVRYDNQTETESGMRECEQSTADMRKDTRFSLYRLGWTDAAFAVLNFKYTYSLSGYEQPRLMCYDRDDRKWIVIVTQRPDSIPMGDILLLTSAMIQRNATRTPSEYSPLTIAWQRVFSIRTRQLFEWMISNDKVYPDLDTFPIVFDIRTGFPFLTNLENMRSFRDDSFGDFKVPIEGMSMREYLHLFHYYRLTNGKFGTVYKLAFLHGHTELMQHIKLPEGVTDSEVKSMILRIEEFNRDLANYLLYDIKPQSQPASSSPVPVNAK